MQMGPKGSGEEAEGKLKQSSLASATMDGRHASRRLFVFDKISGLRFLVDTGADVSVIPPHTTDKSKKATGTLFTANGSPIATFGERAMLLNLGLRRPIRGICRIAEVPYAILGADILYAHNLVPDLHTKTLKDMETGLTVKAKVDEAVLTEISSFDKTIPVAEILAEYTEIIKPSSVIVKSSVICQNIQSRIKLKRPVSPFSNGRDVFIPRSSRQRR